MLCQIMEHTILIKIKDAIQSLSVPRTSLIILLVIYFSGCTAPTDEKLILVMLMKTILLQSPAQLP